MGGVEGGTAGTGLLMGDTRVALEKDLAPGWMSEVLRRLVRAAIVKILVVIIRGLPVRLLGTSPFGGRRGTVAELTFAAAPPCRNMSRD